MERRPEKLETRSAKRGDDKETLPWETLPKWETINFDAEMLGRDPLGLMFFWAPGSEPCKSMTPIVEEIATQFAGKLKVAKMNVEEYKGNVARYGVREVPNFVIFKDAGVAKQIVGAVPKAELVRAIEEALR